MVDDELVRQLMRTMGLVPVQVKRRRNLTAADRAAGPIPDLQASDPSPGRLLAATSKS